MYHAYRTCVSLNIAYITIMITFIQVLKFLEYIYMAVSKLEVSDVEKRHVTEIVNSEIQKWLELLVKNVDIKAKEAVPLYNLLRTELKPAELLRKFKPVVIACVSLCMVESQLSKLLSSELQLF